MLRKKKIFFKSLLLPVACGISAVCHWLPVMQRSLPSRYQEGSKRSNALTDSSQGVQKPGFVTLHFPGADSFQTCCFHRDCLSSPSTAATDLAGDAAGLNPPGRAVSRQGERVAEIKACSFSELQTKCGTHQPQRYQLEEGLFRKSVAEKERGRGPRAKALLKRE